MAKSKVEKVEKKKSSKSKIEKVGKKKAGRPKGSASTPRVKKPLPEVTRIKEKMKATDLYAYLAETTGQDVKSVKKLMKELSNVICGSVVKKGAGEFLMPKLFKVKVRDIPAKKARKGISPFTGEETIFKAKPATRKVKILPLKMLKDYAAPPEK